MALLANNRRTWGAALAVCLVFAFSIPGRADSEGSIYAFANRLVFDKVEQDRVTSRSTRMLNVVRLDDEGPLKIAGKVAMPGQSSYVAAYGHYKQQLIVLLWDRIEIYDLVDPTSPRFVTSLVLAAQDSSLEGETLIESTSDGKFLILDSRHTLELTVDGDGRNWMARPAPPPDAAQKARAREPSPAALADRIPTPTPLVLRETSKFRYELAWTDKHQPGVITHRKYVRQFDKASGRMLSQILLRTDVETID